MTRRLDASARLGAVILSAVALHLSSCSNPASICETPVADRKVTGAITRGESTAKVGDGHLIEGTLEAEPFIEYLLVGDRRATDQGHNFSLWSATLSRSDLERVREGNDAHVKVVAVDVCGDPHPIDETLLPIGPDPEARVTGLDLQVRGPNDECYLPADGSAAVEVKVLADVAFTDAEVTLTASQGTFSPPGSPLKVALDGYDEVEDKASARVYFSSTIAGTALLGAVAGGDTKGPIAIPIAAAPRISPPEAMIDRDTPFSIYVHSRGNLASCRAEASHAGVVTLTIAEPELGIVTGVKAVQAAVLDCSQPEILRVEVLFTPGAPDAAQVTLRCSDTYGQEGSATIRVKPQ